MGKVVDWRLVGLWRAGARVLERCEVALIADLLIDGIIEQRPIIFPRREPFVLAHGARVTAIARSPRPAPDPVNNRVLKIDRLACQIDRGADAYQSLLDSQREVRKQRIAGLICGKGCGDALDGARTKTNFFVAPFAQPNSLAAARRFRSYLSVERRRFRHPGLKPWPAEVKT
jgi:hypothetical protein